MPLFVLAGSLMRGSCKAGVAPSAASAARHHNALVRAREVMHQLARGLVINDGADRHLQHDAVTLAASLVRAFAVTPAGFHDDVAAVAAVPAGRTAARHELLAPEGHAAVAAIACLDPDSGFVNEHGRAVIRDSGQSPDRFSLRG